MNIFVDEDEIEMDEIIYELKSKMSNTLTQLKLTTPIIEDDNNNSHIPSQILQKLCYDVVKNYLFDRMHYNNDNNALKVMKFKRRGINNNDTGISDSYYKRFYNKYIKKNMERIFLVFKISYELYKSMIGSFLILFVEQRCNGYNCTMLQNIYSDKVIYDVALSFNSITFIAFIVMYSISSLREFKLRKNLTITKFSPGILGIHYNQDDEIKNIKKRIKILNNNLYNCRFLNIDEHPIYNNSITNNIKKEISFYNYIYKTIGFYTLLLFGINLIISSIIILINNRNQKTFFSLINNILLMGPNIYDIYIIITNEFTPTLSTHWKTFSEYNNYTNKNFNLIISEIKKIRTNFMRDNGLSSFNFDPRLFRENN